MSTADFSDLQITPLDEPNDPTPVKSQRSTLALKSKPDRKPIGRPSKKSKEDELADEVQAFIGLVMAPIGLKDPVCGMAWVENSKAISEAVAAIAIDNPTIVKWLSSGGDIMKWFKLATALSIPVQVTFDHHLRKPQEFAETTARGKHAGPYA